MSNELSVQYTTPAITSNFERLSAEVDAKLEIYRDVTIDIEDDKAVKSAKNDAAYLNAMIKEIDDRRKAIKREYEAPLKAFEAQCKEITDKIQECRNDIKSQLDTAEELRVEKRTLHLTEVYEEFAPILVPVVPFETILEKQWLNKSTPIKKAEDELTAKVEHIATDWETLKSLNLEKLPEAEVVFFDTLSLKQAIDYANRVKDSLKRIDELREVIQTISETSEPVEIEEVYPYTMFIDEATPEQIKQLGTYAKSIGIHGKFKRGAF